MKKYSSFLLSLLCPALVFLQPVPCTDDPPAMTPTCEEACVICDIDGFTGRHESNVPGVAPDDFCTIVVHNAQWIAFIAGSEDLTIRITVSNCQMSAGLEIGLYEGIDCTNFRRVSNCEGGTTTIVSPGIPRLISNTEPLVIGQYYYLVMDGAFGDNCDWTLEVTEGSTEAAPLNTAPLIEGPEVSCPELITTYTTPGLMGGTEYEWRLDGTLISTLDSAEVVWPGDGVFELCLQISNACDEAPPTCRNILVQSIAPTFYQEIICSGECFEVHDSLSLCEEGFYEFNFPTDAGCDSMVIVDLTVFESAETQLSANICEGDSLFIGGIPYFSTDIHTTVLENYLGCDSTVILDLSLIVCEIEGEIDEVPVVCRGESSGQLNFFVTDGTPPFSYNWTQLGSSASGSGSLNTINTPANIANLEAGTYLITLNDDFGNDLVLIQEVTQPTLLSVTLVASDLSCSDSDDGMITALPMGGVGPYEYSWDNGPLTAGIENLTAGTYTVQITDAMGCSVAASLMLAEPAPLVMTTEFIDPDCGGNDTGQAIITSISGGTAPYLHALNGGVFSEQLEYSNLTAGTYTLTTEDANGCITEISETLQARIIPIIDLGVDTSIELAEQLTLRPISSVPLDNFSWSPIDGLSCIDCPNPILTAILPTTYTLSVTSVDDCTTTDSIRISILDVRDVFVPNAFSPNNDGVNDELIVFGGPEVVLIKNFRVFNRWGDLLFEAKELLPNSNTMTWDGRYQGEILGSDVFVWSAEIEFIDGVTLDYSGDVLLLK
ncbi:T9SS C-terminal target domain-containing protein [Lewinella cohaerens]|uniref:T9SS C-terminal target domain-containing protein n=1 Tax=Lewinella cohaerens TaxID=70995 RepID=UPI000476BBB2|nr:T9SS C-terminal target domain-containing protein [Lewinella cohaerens]